MLAIKKVQYATDMVQWEVDGNPIRVYSTDDTVKATTNIESGDITIHVNETEQIHFIIKNNLIENVLCTFHGNTRCDIDEILIKPEWFKYFSVEMPLSVDSVLTEDTPFYPSGKPMEKYYAENYKVK